MKKTLVLSVIALLLAVSPCLAGTINFSGRAGLYSAPGGVGTSTIYGVSADYGLSENLTLRGAVETTSYTVNTVQTTFTPVSVDLIYHQSVAGLLSPYAGLGASYNTTNSGGAVSQTSGAQAVAGIKYSFGGFSAGVEYRYMVTDLRNLGSVSSTYNAYATGAFTQSINI